MVEYSTIEPWQRVDENGVVYEAGSLMAYFEELPDPRKARGKRYSLVTLLVLVFLAKLSGADTPYAIAEWCQARQDGLVALLHLAYGKMPSHHTFRRLLSEMVLEETFEKVMRAYTLQQAETGVGRLIAVDGKRLRGTGRPGEEPSVSTLAVFAIESQQVLTQVSSTAIGGELASAEKALGRVDLRGKVLLADALHTQRKLCQSVVTKHGDYLLTLKDNQHLLYQEVDRLFAPDAPNRTWLEVQTARQLTKGHGRIEERRLHLLPLLPNELDWPGVAQVFRLERRFVFLRQGKVIRVETKTHYGLTSLSHARADGLQLLTMKRRYWQIENGLHYRRDVTFHEDATRMSHSQAALNLTLIHNTILSLFARLGVRNAASTRRSLDAHPSLPFSLLTSAHPRL